jgi:hypothetical protein
LGYIGFQEVVDEDAGHRDIEPDRVGPGGDLPMFFKTFGNGEEESGKDQRHDNDAGDDVGNEYEEVNGANDALTWKFGVSVIVMIEEIAYQEECRTGSGQDHASGVGFDMLSFNTDDTNGDEAGTEAVEAGIHQGQGFDEIMIRVSRGLAKIDIPDQKYDDRSTEPENETDGRFITDVIEHERNITKGEIF